MNIVNVYFTDGYIEWGKLFIESYTYHHGEDDKMIIDTRNLSNKQQREIFGLRNNVSVRNVDLNFKDMAKNAGVEEGRLIGFKREVEKEKVSMGNKVWKLMVAGDDRIKQIYKLINGLNEGDNILHFDADTYIQKNTEEFWKELKENDFSTIFRIDKQISRRGKVYRENRATLICAMGFTVNDRCKEFMRRWMYYIDKVSPPQRDKGYGQTSCYYAYKDMNKKYKDFKWGQFRDKRGKMWMNANKGHKDQLLKKAQENFRRIKK